MKLLKRYECLHALKSHISLQCFQELLLAEQRLLCADLMHFLKGSWWLLAMRPKLKMSLTNLEVGWMSGSKWIWSISCFHKLFSLDSGPVWTFLNHKLLSWLTESWRLSSLYYSGIVPGFLRPSLLVKYWKLRNIIFFLSSLNLNGKPWNLKSFIEKIDEMEELHSICYCIGKKVYLFPAIIT